MLRKSLKEESLEYFVERLASREPTPGGGSAAVAVGAIAAGLISMIMKATLHKANINNEIDEIKKTEIRIALAKADNIRWHLLYLMNKDVYAYENVAKSLKLPKKTDDQVMVRHTAIQEAYRGATLVPDETAHYVNELRRIMENFKSLFPKNMSSDVGVAKLLVDDVLRGAILNVEINLKEIENDDFEKYIEDRIGTLKRSF